MKRTRARFLLTLFLWLNGWRRRQFSEGTRWCKKFGPVTFQSMTRNALLEQLRS
jgi:hypothetical protein